MKTYKVFLLVIATVVTLAENAWGQLVGGTIRDSHAVCYNSGATPFTSEAPASGGVAPYTYTWQWSTSSSTAGSGTWNDIGSSNSETFDYSATPLTQTTYFTRRVVDAAGTPLTAYSNVITVTVDPVSVGGSLAGGTTVCSGTNSTELILSDQVGSVQEWRYSTDNWSTYSTAAGGSTTYTATDLTATTKYRAIVKSGVCSSVNSSDVTIVVDPATEGGSLVGGTTVCSGTNSTELTLSDQVGTVQEWRYSTDNWSTYSTAAGGSTTYTATNLTATTKYRAIVKSGVCSSVNSSDAEVTVNTPSEGGVVTGGTVIIEGATSGLLTLAEHVGTIVRWQYSTNGTDWFNISNTATTYTSDPLTTTTHFRAVVQSGVCPEDYSTSTTVTVDNAVPSASLAYSDPEGLFYPGQEVVITATFSEDMADSPVPQLVFGGVSLAGTVNMVKNTASSYKYTYTVENVNGTVNLTLATGKDLAGNIVNPMPTSGGAFNIDNIPPSAPNVSGSSSTNDDTPKWTWSSGGGGNGTFRYKLNSSDLSSGATETLSLEYIQATSLPEGEHTLYVQERDDAGNWSSSGSFTVTIDKTTLAPSLIKPADGSASDATLAVRFNLPESPLVGSVVMRFVDSEGYYYDRIVTLKNIVKDINEFTLNGENLASNTTYVQSVVTSPSGGEAKLFSGTNYNVTVEYKDALGNDVAISGVNNFFYSNTPPTADIIDVSPDPRNSNAGTVRVSFSWRVVIADVNKSDFRLTRNGESVDISGIPEITYTDINTKVPPTAKHYDLDLTSVTASEGTYVLTLDASIANIRDRFGNILLVSASDTWVNDLTKPTVTVTSTLPSKTNASTIPVTIQFSEAVTGFDAADIVVTNADKSNFASVDGDTYTIDLTPSADGVITLNIAANVCTDLAGNGNTIASEFSIISDRTKPILTSVGIASSNANPSYAKVNDNVIITFTANEQLRAKPVVTIKTHTIVDADIVNTTGNTWTATYKMTNGDDEGPITFSIAYMDVAGNSGIAVESVDDGSSVEFYKNAPTLTEVTIESSNTPNNWARVGTLITLNFKSAIKLANVNTTISNHVAAASNPSGDKKTWIATYTMLAADVEGIIPFSINFTDIPGNSGVTVSATTDGGNVTFDKTFPLLNAVSIASNNPLYPETVGVGGKVTVSVTGSENIQITSATTTIGTTVSRTPVITGSGANWYISYTMQSSDVDGPVNFTVNYADLAGNVGGSVSASTNGSAVNFDNTPPSLSFLSIASDNTSSNERATVGDLVKLQFTADDSIVNVVAKINNKSAIVTPKGSNSWEAEYPISSSIADGNIVLSVNYKDLAGNAAESTVTTDGSKVLVDKTFPSFVSVSIQSNNSNSTLAKDKDLITLNFKTSEGIKTPEVWIHGVDVSTSVTGGPKEWSVNKQINSGEAEGVVSLLIAIEDSTGNIPANQTATKDGSFVIFDDSEPVVTSITTPSGVYKVGGNIVVTIVADAKNYTGKVVEVNGKTQTLVNNLNNTYSINYLITEGDNELVASANLPVNIVFEDPAGLTTALSTANVVGGTVTIDSDIPKIQSFSSTAESTGILRVGNQIVFTLKPETVEEGLTITPSTYNGKGIVWATTDGGTTYTATYTVVEGDTERETPLNFGDVKLSDDAGNYHTITANPIQKKIYTVKPTIEISGTKTKCYDGNNETVTFGFTGRAPFDLWYEVDGNHYSELGINASTYQIQIPSGSVALDSLRDASTNKVTVAPSNAVVTVKPLPVVSLNITGSPYSPDSPADDLDKYVLPSDKRTGVFSGEGVGFLGEYFFYPSLIPSSLQDKNIPISYSYTDPTTGCTAIVTAPVYVSSQAINISGLNVGYCNYSSPAQVLGILPSGHTGEFKVVNNDYTPLAAGWTEVDQTHLELRPQEIPVGTYRVIYTATRVSTGEVASTVEKSFIIEAPKTGISIVNLANEYCESKEGADIEFTVSGVTLEPGDKGHFTGGSAFAITDGSHTAKFKLSAAEANKNYSVSYTYESAVGCLSSPANHTLTINSLPEMIFSLKDNYNFNQGAIPLVGNHTSTTSYLFSGEGVSRDTLFTSAVRVGAPIVITYSYTDGNGCYNQTKDTTYIYKATETITNLKSVYCYENSYFDISCTSSISDTLTGKFISKSDALENTGRNVARYFLDRIGNGRDTVYFTYNVKGTEYSVSKPILIDSIGAVQIISNLDSMNFCKSLSKVQLSGLQDHALGGQGSFSYSGKPSALLNRGNTAELYPTEEGVGVYSVTYTYTSTSGCTSEVSENINIYSVPVANFAISTPCPDAESPVQFINLSTTDNGAKWQWNLEGQEFADKNPTYQFQSTGNKKVTLLVTASNGCTAQKDSVLAVGLSINANFTWNHDCNTGAPVVFTCTSSGTIANYKWKLDKTIPMGSSAIAQYNFTETGKHAVELAIQTADGCIDTIAKQIMIQP